MENTATLHKTGHGFDHKAYDNSREPHPIHHIIGPVFATLATIAAAVYSFYKLQQAISGETSAWSSLASFIFFPIAVGGIYVLVFLLARALGRWHAIGTVIGVALGVSLMFLWTNLWINSYNASPEQVLKQKAAAAKTVNDCAKVESDQSYWQDCMKRLLKTDKDFATCLSQAQQFVRPFNDSASAPAFCGAVYALEKKDANVCDNLSLTNDRALCHEQYTGSSQ